MSSPIGEIRPAQLITTFGPGSIMDAKMDSITILDLRYWANTGAHLYDARLAQFLHVSYFVKPRSSRYEDLPVVSFPNFHVCSRCNLLFDIRKNFDLSDYMNNGPKCPDCGRTAFTTRFIISCDDNHLDDFPWSWWVHRGHNNCQGKMYLETVGFTSSLADLRVRCTCKEERNMSGATDRAEFENFQCSGLHPFRPGSPKKQCEASVIPLQRGASNVYFPVLRSALSIPPWQNPIDELMDDHISEINAVIRARGDVSVIYDDYFKNRFTRDQFDEAFARRQLEIDKYSQIKEMEYDAISNFQDFDKAVQRYFKADEERIPDTLKPYFSRIIKIHRLREVLVLLGFTRNSSPEPEVGSPSGIVWLNSGSNDRKWLPAVDINGEGIFIEFNHESLLDWRNQVETHSTRLSTVYKRLYGEWLQKKNWTMSDIKDAIYVMIHTFSHLLIKELANECGYSSSALKERIYYNESLRMAGLLIYTGDSDKEGSLGGLVEMGNIDKLLPIMLTSLENAILCTNDPLCSTYLPNEETMNGSACHSCCMISETSCETGNTLLDRSLVISLPERNEKGYFDGLI